MTVTLCLSCSLGLLNRRPRGPLCWVLAFFIASYQHLLWTPTHQGPKSLRPSVAFPTTSRLISASNCPIFNSTGSSNSTELYNRRRPLDIWNRMFNRHQAKITVIPFRGHSLPVHHSVVAQWDLHLVLYYQP